MINRPINGDPKFPTWNREDSMNIAWLWNSMIPEISGTCIFLNTAKQIWDAVDHLFQSQRSRSSIWSKGENSSGKTREQNSYWKC